MKKILTICACLVAGAAMAQTTPIEISDRAGLEAIANNLTDSYILTADIDLTGGDDWSPIGTTDEAYSFQGTFDGNGYSISNLHATFEASNATYVGLFGRIGDNGIVRNVNLVGGELKVTGGECTTGNIGSIAGVNHGEILNCTSNVSVTCYGTNADVGGIAGENGEANVNPGVIKNCTFTGKIETLDQIPITTYLGGIVGNNPTAGLIQGCKTKDVEHYYDVNSTTTYNAKLGIYGQNNGTILDNYDVEGTTVKFVGRTLYKDGEWNTICLPFDVTIVGSIFEGAIVKELDVTTKETSTPDVYKTRVYQKDGDVFYTLNLEFVDVSIITAGKPYLIKWTDGKHLENPVFTNVDMNSYSENPIGVTSADGCVTFQGLLSAKDIATGGDNSILFLSGDNTLYCPNAAMTIGANRAYFQLNNNFTFADSQVPSTASIRAFSLSYGEEFGSATDIDSVNEYSSTLDASWYTLQGVPLDGKPTEKGIYIYNGKKVMIK